MSLHGTFNVSSDELDITFLHGDTFRLDEYLEFTRPNGERWFALPGQESDGASIPRPLWTLLGHPLLGEFRRAAILHDTYYRKQYKGFARSVIDQVLYEALLADGCPKFKARLIWLGVRIGGAVAWYLNSRKLTH